MPTFIVKADPDDDFYVHWSTVVDAPTKWGPRDSSEPAERWERADQNGTSAAWPELPDDEQPFGWNDDEFMVMEIEPYAPGGHYWTLPRKNLRAFCERIEQGVDPSDLMIANPFE